MSSTYTRKQHENNTAMNEKGRQAIYCTNCCPVLAGITPRK